MQKPFTAEQFTATEFTNQGAKAKFGNHLVKFLLAGCPVRLFHKWFYRQLSNCFGHIAHFDSGGFYGNWFSDAGERDSWIRNMLNHPCYGQPDHTFCDVERAVQSWYAENKADVDAVLLNKVEEEDAAEYEEGNRLSALEGQTMQEFIVARASSNTGAFGHCAYVVVAQDGSAFELQIIPCNLRLSVGQVIKTTLRDCKPTWAGLYVECPRKYETLPQKVVDEVWVVQA
jgi:hypothetical protein